MRSTLPFSRPLFWGGAAIAVLMTFFVLFHLGGVTWQFAQLTGAILGGALTLVSARTPIRDDENVEPWLGREQIAWTLVGCGLLLWGFGESIWRYYILSHQSPFPSFADIGYAALPPFVFAGLLLQPSSGAGRGRLLTLLDSFIAMGSLLAIGWYLLLGTLAFASSENMLGKFLGLYYPTTDIALLSCVVLLLLRGQGRLYQASARKTSLIAIGLGLCLFAASDFLFNVQQAAGTYIDGTYVDLGWPFGIMLIGIAAYLRRFLPLTDLDTIDQRLRRRVQRVTFGPAQLLTYILLGILLVVLPLNIFASDKIQLAIRPVLLLATIIVIGLVVARQVFTILDNEQLSRRQADALERLERANTQIEEQARLATQRNNDLATGILHLKDVQARLANGNLRARANLSGGELLPLGASLNLMADRLARTEQSDNYARGLSRAVQELSAAIDQYKRGKPFIVPLICNSFPEVSHLLAALELNNKVSAAIHSSSAPVTPIPSVPETPSPERARLQSIATRPTTFSQKPRTQ